MLQEVVDDWVEDADVLPQLAMQLKRLQYRTKELPRALGGGEHCGVGAQLEAPRRDGREGGGDSVREADLQRPGPHVTLEVALHPHPHRPMPLLPRLLPAARSGESAATVQRAAECHSLALPRSLPWT